VFKNDFIQTELGIIPSSCFNEELADLLEMSMGELCTCMTEIIQSFKNALEFRQTAPPLWK
jgi:hypothetical protein